MRAIEVKTSSEAQTIELGRRMAGFLKRGDVVGCIGELGAGKTTLIKGIAWGLGVKRAVKSPSFVIITEYRAKFPVYHIDLYRIADQRDVCLGQEDTSQVREEDILECLYSDGIALVEWAEKIWHLLPPDTIKVVLKNLGIGDRLIEIHSSRFRGI